MGEERNEDDNDDDDDDDHDYNDEKNRNRNIKGRKAKETTLSPSVQWYSVGFVV